MSVLNEIKQYMSELTKKIQILQQKNSEQIDEFAQLDKKIETIKDGSPAAQPVFWPKQMFRFRVIGLLVYYIWTLASQVLDVLYLIITAYIISLAMESVIQFFRAKRIGRGGAIALSYSLLFIFLLSSLIFVVPFMLSQMADIVRLILKNIFEFQTLLQANGLEFVVSNNKYLPQFMKDLFVESINNQAFLKSVQMSIQENISQIINVGSSYATDIGNKAVNFLTGFFSALFQIWIVFTLSVFFSIEKEKMIVFLATLWGSRKSYYQLKIEKLYKKLWFWLKSQFFLSIYIGVMVYIFLWILELFGMSIPSKLSLALISGLTEFIPYIGPTLGAIPAILVASSSYWLLWLLVVSCIYFVIQRTENNILIPALMNRTLWISPVLVFISMLIGWMVLWFLGVVLAVPVAVILSVMFEDKF